MSDKELWSAVFIAAIRAGKCMGDAKNAANYAVEARSAAFPNSVTP